MKQKNNGTVNSVLSEKSSFQYTEAYVRLRTNFIYVTLNGEYKKVLFTSCEQGEGKSITVLNLAISLAKSGKRVLLLDCDIRRSNMHNYTGHGEKRKMGLSEILCGLKTVEECLLHDEENGFDVIFGGGVVPNPSELLGSGRMKELLARLEKDYDYVLMDAPPVMAVSDPLILSTMADGVIFVVRQNAIRSQQYQFAVQSLKNIGARMLGGILNMYRASKDQSYYSYGYGYGKRYYKKSGYYTGE